jgi:hypothetical protein
VRHPFIQRYAGIDEALADCRAVMGEEWDEPAARAVMTEVLVPDAGELVFNGGTVLSGVAHWQP